jgi:F-box and WD-40 domain protein CDC4
MDVCSPWWVVYSVVYDPSRNQACSGSMDGTVRIWNLNNGQCQHTLIGHTSLVGLLGLSPSSLVSAAADSTLRIWDPATGELRHALSGHTGAITCFQHDEFKVLSGSDGTLKMWDVRDGQQVRDLLTGVVGVWQVVFEGRWCVAASNRNDQTMLDVWDFGAEHDDEDSDGWVGETPSGLYDEESDVDEDEYDPEPEDVESVPTAASQQPPPPTLDGMDQDGDEVLDAPSEPEVDEELERGPGEDDEDDATRASTEADGPPTELWLRSRMDMEDDGPPSASSTTGPSFSSWHDSTRRAQRMRSVTEEPTPVGRPGPSMALRALPMTETPTRQRTSRTVPPRRR